MAGRRRNRDGVLHADHLDSFVRGARWRARVRVDALALARGMRPDGAHLTFEREHGEALLDAIVDEALAACPATAVEAATLLRGTPRFEAVEAEGAGSAARWRCAVRAAYLPRPRLRDAEEDWPRRCEAAFAPLRGARELFVALAA